MESSLQKSANRRISGLKKGVRMGAEEGKGTNVTVKKKKWSKRSGPLRILRITDK
jgi:hypothetical protein